MGRDEEQLTVTKNAMAAADVAVCLSVPRKERRIEIIIMDIALPAAPNTKKVSISQAPGS